MPCRLASLTLTLASAGAAMAAPPMGTKTFGGFTATCNNLGACVVIGASEGDALAYLRIAREAGVTAAPALKVVVVTQEAVKGDGSALRLTAHEAGTATDLGAVPAVRDDTTLTAVVAPDDKALAAIDAMRNAATLDYAIGDVKGALELKGLSAALRWIDAQQGRAGTPTALVARGMTPLGQVSPPGQPPVIVAAPAGSAHEIAKPVLPPAVLAMAAKICDPDVVKAHEGAQAWQLDAGRRLFAIPCTQGAYNVASAFYSSDVSGPHPLDLPNPAPVAVGGDAPNILVNAAFDPKAMALSAFDKGRGLGDCGTSATWVWTGRVFAPLSVSSLDACPGALPDDWPNLYTAVRAP